MNTYLNLFSLCLIFGIVDRIENDYAAIETNLSNNTTVILLIDLLPESISEGDSLCLVSNNNQNLQLLPNKK